jgi:hypothetical protein
MDMKDSFPLTLRIRMERATPGRSDWAARRFDVQDLSSADIHHPSA